MELKSQRKQGFLGQHKVMSILLSISQIMYELHDSIFELVLMSLKTSSFHSYLCTASQGAAVNSDVVGFLQHAVDVIQE